jgi:DNA-binding NarL/FixJ family response regulator
VTATACGGPSPGPIRVLVVDDHDAFRAGLTELLSGESGIEVVGECRDGSEVLAADTRLRPDVVLMDLNMPGVDGEEATRILRAAGSRAHIVVLTAEGPGALSRAMSAGAHALVGKDEDPDRLLQSVRTVAGSRRCFPDGR